MDESPPQVAGWRHALEPAAVTVAPQLLTGGRRRVHVGEAVGIGVEPANADHRAVGSGPAQCTGEHGEAVAAAVLEELRSAVRREREEVD